MNKFLYLFCFLLFPFHLFAQTTSVDSSKTKLKPYVSAGLSIGNVDRSSPNADKFSKSSFPSVEVGVSGQNLSLGAVFGCENLFATSSARGFYELKTSLAQPIGKFSIYGLLGAGSYFEKSFNAFIEYGAGFSYVPQKLGYFAQYSNWAGTNYVSVGLTYSF